MSNESKKDKLLKSLRKIKPRLPSIKPNRVQAPKIQYNRSKNKDLIEKDKDND